MTDRLESLAKDWYQRFYDATQYAQSPADVVAFEIANATAHQKTDLDHEIVQVQNMSKHNQEVMLRSLQTAPHPQHCFYRIVASDDVVHLSVSDKNWIMTFVFAVENSQLLLAQDIGWEAIGEEDSEE